MNIPHEYYISLIDKYLDDVTSGDEDRELYEWISASAANFEQFRERKEARDRIGLSFAAALPLETAKATVRRKIDRKRRTRTFRWFTAAAAVVALLVALPNIIVTGPDGDGEPKVPGLAYSSERGEIREVTLPDGSTAWLNVDSRLSYIFEESRGLRIVYLSGEAFFDVVRDTLNPFIVRTDHIDARVLGTKFNVNAYPDQEIVETTIMEGRVALSVHGGDGGAVEVTANDRALLVKGERSFSFDKVDAEGMLRWREGTLVFRGEPLARIAVRLERIYDVDIALEDPSLGDMLYTATFDKDTPVTDILDLFVFTSPIEYTITGDKIEITLKPSGR